jgi:hypothetical protein
MSPATCRLIVCLLAVAGLSGVARGQNQGDQLKLQAVVLGGTRTSVTESWATLFATVENPATTPRLARVVVFHPARPDVQYARDLWVPGRSSMTAWLPIGPAPPDRSTIGRELEMLLFDRTSGQDQLILPPTEERVRSRALPYKKRETTTTLFLDLSPDDPSATSRPHTLLWETVLLTHMIRQATGLVEHVSVVGDGYIPPTPEALDGVDQVVLAGNRLARDPVGRQVLRQWVEHGGRLWVMLDMVDADAIAPIFGNELHLQVVDRVGLTTVAIHRGKDGSVYAPARDFERPVEFVRVVPTGAAQVQSTVNGWPASFTLTVGRGKVVFTTLGGPAWHRPRGSKDPQPVYPRRADLPVATPPLEELAAEFRPRSGPPLLAPDDLRPLLSEEIGYTIVGRSTAGLILGAFVLALVGLGIGLRRSRRPELVGWVAAGAAVAAAAVFVFLGEGSRRSVPATVGVAEVVDVVPASGELAVNGVFAMYQPASGPAQVATRDGALVDLDQEGLEGQTRRRVQTDIDAWHWENLSVPAGVRTGPFRYTTRSEGLRATAQFGPAGLKGRLEPGPFRNPADAMINSLGREYSAAPFAADGTFTAGIDDLLPPGQFLPGSVLTDHQQKRQTIYRQLFAGKLPPHMEGRELLLAWAEPRDLPFEVPEGARAVGTALLLVPLEIERTAPGTGVTIPRAFVPFRRLGDGALLYPSMEGSISVEQRLRFQLPASVLPLTLERATLTLKVRAPSRRLTVSGLTDGRPVTLHESESPTADPIRLEITDQRMLQLDAQGGLHLNVTIGEASGAGDAKWTIESIGLDVVGRTAGGQ